MASLALKLDSSLYSSGSVNKFLAFILTSLWYCCFIFIETDILISKRAKNAEVPTLVCSVRLLRRRNSVLLALILSRTDLML